MKFSLLGLVTGMALCCAATDFKVGTAVHFAFGQGNLQANLDLIRTAGVRLVRDEYNWSSVEQTPGTYEIGQSFLDYLDAVTARGMTPLVVLCYGNPAYEDGGYPTTAESIEAYVRYAETVVKALPPGPRYVEIWNEWDGGCGMDPRFGKGSVENYMKLIQAVYPRLKAIDPELTIVGGSFCSVGFLESALKLGLAEYCDMISLHTYNYEEVLSAGAPEEWFERIRRVNDILAPYYPDALPRLIVTEMGWPTHIGAMSSTETMQAAHLGRLFLLAQMIPNLECVSWYDFQNDGYHCDNREENFGTVRADLTPKPSWHVLRDVAHLIENAEFTGVEASPDAGLRALRFTTRDGRDLLILWSSLDEALLQVELSGPPEQKLTMRHAGRAPVEREWGYYDWVENRPAGLQPELFSVTVGNLPLILEADTLDQVAIQRVIRRPFDERERAKSTALRLPSAAAIATPVGAEPILYRNTTGENYLNIATEWQGAEDLSYEFSLSYDAANLYWDIAVRDNVFSQIFDTEETWNGDGLQVALQTAENSGDGDRTEFDLALTARGPVLFLRSNRLGLPTGDSDLVGAEISRDGTTTRYRLTIPAQALQLPDWHAGMMLTAAFLVNDADADPKIRRGYLPWGGGIGNGRNPELYHLIVLAPAE